MSYTREERGLLGYEALLRKYGPAQVNRWRRTGGRPRHRSYTEIVADPHRKAATGTRQSAGRKEAPALEARATSPRREKSID